MDYEQDLPKSRIHPIACKTPKFTTHPTTHNSNNSNVHQQIKVISWGHMCQKNLVINLQINGGNNKKNKLNVNYSINQMHETTMVVEEK